MNTTMLVGIHGENETKEIKKKSYIISDVL